MNMKKTKRLLSFLLALAILVCGLPFGAYATDATLENATYNYTTFENAEKLNIEYYYSTLGMHDGVGLEVKNGSITPDADWIYQINTVDKFVDAKEAYAIYFIENGTDFVANFSTTTDLDDMKFYVSGNGVDWDVAEVEKDYANQTASLIDQPDYISYVKISWPLYLYLNSGDREIKFFEENALTAVTFTQGTHSANYKRINYANETAIGGFQNQSLGLSNGVIRPDWSKLNAATAENSYNGFVSYRVQPGTRFSLTVTNARGNEAVGTKLGLENPLDYSVEIYVSGDNYNFTKLENVYTNSARHRNNESAKDAVRSTDYSFIVPDDAVIVKCKFPMTKNLVSAGLHPSYIGNDFMEINKVEYTALPMYEYADISTDIKLTADTMSQFGISAYNPNLIREGIYLNPKYMTNGVYAEYDVVSGTDFFASYQKMGNLTHILAKSDYVMTLKGYNPATAAWEDVSTLTIPKGSDYNSLPAKFMLGIKAADNKYSRIRIQWPNWVDDQGGGNWAFGLIGVSFTQLKNYDYTNTTTYGALTQDNKASFGINSYGNGLGRNEGNNIIEPKGTQGAYAVYNIMPGSAFAANFKVMGNFTSSVIPNNDFVMKLQGYNQETSAWEDADTLTIKRGTDASTIASRYTLKIDANAHKYTKIKVLWPSNYVYAWASEWSFGLESVSANVAGQEYDYSTLKDLTLDKTTRAQFAISETAGTLQFDGTIDPDSTYLASTGLTASVAYDVEPNTYFRADFKVKWSPNLTKYTAVKDYVLKLEAYTEDNTWVEVKNITIPKGTTEVGNYYSLELTKEENMYSLLRIHWPARVSADDVWNNGDDTLALKAVTLTKTEGTLYDYDLLEDFTAENKALFGMSSCHANLVAQAGAGYVNPAWAANGVYAQYNVTPDTPFVAKFIKQGNLTYVLAKADYVMTLKGWNVETSAWETIKTLTIPKGSDYNSLPTLFTMRISAEENDYTKIRVQWPNKVEDQGGGNYTFGLKRVTFTQSLNYDYYDADADGVCVTKPASTLQITTDNVANYGATAVGGDLRVSTDGQLDPDGTILASNGHATTWIGYTVASNTPFYAAVNVKWSGHLNNYLKLQDYVLTLQGKDSSGTYVDVKTITIPMGSTISSGAKYGFKLTAAENNYTELRILWPAKVNGVDAWTYYGDDSLALTEVSYLTTAVEKTPKSSALKPLVFEEITKEEIVSAEVALRPQINMAYLGDKVDLSGLQVALTYATGETRIVDYGFASNDLSLDSVGDNTVTVICRGAEIEVPVVGYCYMGDFNRDKEVNLKDIVRYKKYLVGVSENEGADITVNGDMTSAGVLVELRKYFLGDDDCLDLTKQWRGHANDTTDYTFKDTITLEVLNNYLGHTVNYSLGNVIDYFGGAFNVNTFNEGLGVALNVGAKYVQRSGGEWNMTGQFMSRWSDEIAERLAFAHSIDPEMIFEASIFESVTNAVAQIAVPAWVHEKFGVELAEGVESVNYSRSDVIFEESVYEENENLENGSWQSTPDITKVEWQMLVYYRATQFIDLGYEAIHLGQTGLTGINDTDNAAWAKVIGFIREYAAENARRGYVIINSHDEFGGFTYDGKQLCDFIMTPTRPHAAETETETKLPSETEAQECIVESGYWDDSPYGAGYTGVAPTGETYENYPYMVEFDNYGDSIPGGEENIGNPQSYVWGLDEYSWYCNQPEWYRAEFLEYLAGELATYNDNGFISMPLGRGNYYDVLNEVSRVHFTRGGAEEAFVKAYFE